MLRLHFQWIILLLSTCEGLQKLISEHNFISITAASYQVAVEVGGKVQCGGTIVNHQWIITAASCLYNISSASTDLRVRAGSTRTLCKGSFNWVSSVTIHPEFDGRSNDIALIELAVPLKFKRSVQPITLASKSPRPNSVGRITGWGILNNVSVSTLVQVNVTIMNKTVCEDLYGINLLCVNDEPTFTPCDPGGPLIVGRQLVGISTYCYRPSLKNNISAFTDISQYKRWILQTVYNYF